MLNDEDVNKLLKAFSKVFSTKQDLKDLSKTFSTKQDLKDLSKTFSTKQDLDDLAIMIAKGFGKVEDRFNFIEKDVNEVKKELNEVKEDISEVKENLRATRSHIMNIGDKFVSYHTFDQLASRVSHLEKNQNKKISTKSNSK